jgi:hypothetical protein
MMAIFEGLVGDIMEVFMVNFSIFRDAFDLCLGNLKQYFRDVKKPTLR